jgi:arginine/lysine/ornithine decarboxylase
MTAKPRSCEGLRETLLKIAPVGTPARQVTSWLESEGFTCQRTGANQQTIYATRTDQSSYWSTQRWMVVCTLDQDKVAEFTVTQGK